MACVPRLLTPEFPLHVGAAWDGQRPAGFENGTAVSFEPNAEEAVGRIRVFNELLESALANRQLLLTPGHLAAMRKAREFGQREHPCARAKFCCLGYGRSYRCQMVKAMCPHGKCPKRSSPPIALFGSSEWRNHRMDPRARRVCAVPHNCARLSLGTRCEPSLKLRPQQMFDPACARKLVSLCNRAPMAARLTSTTGPARPLIGVFARSAGGGTLIQAQDYRGFDSPAIGIIAETPLANFDPPRSCTVFEPGGIQFGIVLLNRWGRPVDAASRRSASPCSPAAPSVAGQLSESLPSIAIDLKRNDAARRRFETDRRSDVCAHVGSRANRGNRGPARYVRRRTYISSARAHHLT